MKALDLLKAEHKEDAAEQAERIIKPVKRNLQKTFIDPVVERIERLEETIYKDSIFNEKKGIVTGAEAEKQFSSIIQSEYDLTLARAELKAKQEVFNKYFEDGTTTA